MQFRMYTQFDTNCPARRVGRSHKTLQAALAVAKTLSETRFDWVEIREFDGHKERLATIARKGLALSSIGVHEINALI